MEFGSDFHYFLPNDPTEELKTIFTLYPNSVTYALGRHALQEVILKENIETIWLPEYYCHESIENIKNETDVKFYKVSPLENPIKAISNIPFKNSDWILLMNFFGFWGDVRTPEINCHVIEDHSHDLISNWARTSTADYCFASLRKTLPLAEGGIIWSNTRIIESQLIPDSKEHNDNANLRLRAMLNKASFLNGDILNKEDFLRQFRKSENFFDKLAIAPLNEEDLVTLKSIDIEKWYKAKKENWHELFFSCGELNDCEILDYRKFNSNNSTPFSLILLFANKNLRNKVRQKLISSDIYPAILWMLPDIVGVEEQNFSERMLSIHCDGRYNKNQMRFLGDKLKEIINNF